MYKVFERYVNFEFYKTKKIPKVTHQEFEKYVNFEFYKTSDSEILEEVSLRDM